MSSPTRIQPTGTFWRRQVLLVRLVPLEPRAHRGFKAPPDLQVQRGAMVQSELPDRPEPLDRRAFKASRELQEPRVLQA